MTEEKPMLAPWCPMCGYHEKCDEDGLCSSCGASLLLREVHEKIITAERERCEDIVRLHPFVPDKGISAFVHEILDKIREGKS